jgi:copper homeostasis protein
MGNDFVLEIAAFSLEGALAAQLAGADRIEFCDNPGEGGTTPSFGALKTARKRIGTQLYPIIRPRGGNFVYTDDEFEIMKIDLQLCKAIKCDGVVIGMLNADGTVDVKRCEELVKLADGMGVTFHRAFDRTVDPFEAMEDIIDIGCERILTSGQVPNALDGKDLIWKLIEKAEDRITIMPGSGVRSDNIAELATATCATEFHSSARMLAESKKVKQKKTMDEKLATVSVDEKEIKAMIKALEKHFR